MKVATQFTNLWEKTKTSKIQYLSQFRPTGPNISNGTCFLHVVVYKIFIHLYQVVPVVDLKEGYFSSGQQAPFPLPTSSRS